MTTPYNEIKALSYSGAKEILKSPSHYKAWLEKEESDSPALRLGRLVHLASLQPQVYDRTVRVAPECDRRTKEGKEIWSMFEQSLKEGEELIKKEDSELITNVSLSARDGIDKVIGANGIIKPASAPIVETAYEGKLDGIAIKGRPDMVIPGLNGDAIIDVKTTQSADYKSFSKDCANYKYHLQAAFYMTMTGATRFFIVAVEKTPPYAHAIFELDAEAISVGKALMKAACLTYRECSLYDNWPGYPSSVQNLSLPKWALDGSIDI